MTYQPFPSPFLISGTFAEGAAVTAADPGVVILGVDQTAGAPGTYEPMNLASNNAAQQSGDRGPMVFGMVDFGSGDLEYRVLPLRTYASSGTKYAVNIGSSQSTDFDSDLVKPIYSLDNRLLVAPHSLSQNTAQLLLDESYELTIGDDSLSNGVVTVAMSTQGGALVYAATLVFEVRAGGDLEQWHPVYGYPAIGPPVSTAVVNSTDNPAGMWQFYVSGNAQFRVRCTAWSGVDGAYFAITAGNSPGEWTRRVMLSNGTVFADVLDLTNNNPLAVALVDTAGTQIATLPVSVASVPSHAVTNAGTFAVQATLAAETTKVIGTVNQGTSPWVISGAVTTSGTVTATLAAETTKVIGTVNQGTSPWVTSLTSTTLTAVTPGTAAANLGKAQAGAYVTGDTGVAAMAVYRAGGTALTATGNAYGPLMMDVLDHLWISGSNIDGGAYSAAGTLVTNISSLILGAVFDDTPLSSVATGKSGALRMSANRNLYGTIRDAAGNERGANVDASNRLTVLATQTGTWTVQPGNTPNTTAWLTDFPAPSNVTSTAYEASHLIKASAGTLYSLTGYNSKTSAQFIQVHNATAVPADTAVPVVIFSVPASSNFAFELQRGRVMSTGIAVCNSSTGPTKTLGATDVWFDVQFI